MDCTWYRFRLASLVLLLALSSICSEAFAQSGLRGTPVTPRPAVAQDYEVHTGEIGLSGYVTEVDGNSQTIKFAVFSVSTITSNGICQGSTVVPARFKTIYVTSIAQIYALDGKSIALTDLPLGIEITAVGKDSGTGQPLVPRILGVGSDLAAKSGF